MMKIQTSNTAPSHPHGVLAATPLEFIDSNSRSQSRMAAPALFATSGPEEVLVIEERAHLRPAQLVESKLTRMLQEAAFPVSHLQVRGMLKTR